MAKSRLEKIKEKLKTTDLGGGGTDFWKPKPGANIIRIFPEVGEMEVFWQDIGQHFVKQGSNWKTWVCPNYVAEEPCPICEFVKELYASGDPDDKELASNLRVSKSFSMNVLDRKEPEKGPQIFNAGVMIFRQLVAMINDPEYSYEDEDGEEYLLLTDPDEGLDIKITREGSGRQTKYIVSARRKLSPLADDYDKIDELLDQAVDLTPVWLSDNASEDSSHYKDGQGKQVAVWGIAPYERIQAEFEGVEEEEEEPEFEDDDEDDEISAARQAIQRRRNRHSAADDEEEDDSTPRRRRPRRRSR